MGKNSSDFVSLAYLPNMTTKQLIEISVLSK